VLVLATSVPPRSEETPSQQKAAAAAVHVAPNPGDLTSGFFGAVLLEDEVGGGRRAAAVPMLRSSPAWPGGLAWSCAQHGSALAVLFFGSWLGSLRV